MHRDLALPTGLRSGRPSKHNSDRGLLAAECWCLRVVPFVELAGARANPVNAATGTRSLERPRATLDFVRCQDRALLVRLCHQCPWSSSYLPVLPPRRAAPGSRLPSATACRFCVTNDHSPNRRETAGKRTQRRLVEVRRERPQCHDADGRRRVAAEPVEQDVAGDGGAARQRPTDAPAPARRVGTAAADEPAAPMLWV